MKNYYIQVIKRSQEIKRNPVFRTWGLKEKLNGRQITRAAVALAKGKGNF